MLKVDNHITPGQDKDLSHSQEVGYYLFRSTMPVSTLGGGGTLVHSVKKHLSILCDVYIIIIITVSHINSYTSYKCSHMRLPDICCRYASDFSP